MAIGDAWVNGSWVDAGWQSGSWFDSGIPFSNVSGTALSGLTEQQVIDGGETIILTLSNDTWVAAGAAFDAQRQNIIDGITSAQSEALGWNNVVRDNEVVTSVVRTSDTVVTITLSAAPTYNVTSDETITATIPASALVTSATPIVGAPTIGVTADAEPSKAKGGRVRKPRYLVEIDGEFFDADSITAVQFLLKQAEEVAKESAARDARQAPEKIRIKPPRIRVSTPSGSQTSSATLRREIKQTQTNINAIYRSAQTAIDEIRRATRERQEEETIISLLL